MHQYPPSTIRKIAQFALYVAALMGLLTAFGLLVLNLAFVVVQS